MRSMVGSMVAAFALIGCASPDTVALEHRSELATQSRGVQLSEDGRSSHVGMMGTTCEVGTQYAMIGDDFDYDSGDDTVVDLTERPGVGISAIVVTPGKVNVTTPDVFPWSTSIEVSGVLEARFTGEGFVALQVPPMAADACAIAWHDIAGQPVASVSSLGVECTPESAFTADADTGTAWVSTASGVIRVGRDGATLAIDPTPFAKLAWDGASDALYVGAAGSEQLQAFEFDGAPRWSVALPGGIVSLAAMGAGGAAAVSVELADGTGEFVVVNGATGEIGADLPTPSAAHTMDVSADGKVLAVSLPSAVHYFDILAIE